MIMEKVVAVIAFVASVYISWEHCAGYWVVGPVFAAAMLAANYPKVIRGLSWKHAAFLGFSTLIYALVRLIGERGWKFESDLLDSFFGSLSAGVVLGSVLMPFLHARLFDVDSKTARGTSAWLILSWFGVVLLANLSEWTGWFRNVNYGLISIALWQGICFERLKFARPAPRL